MQIIDGRAVSAQLKSQFKQKIQDLKKTGREPGLAVIIVGDDAASKVYVANKIKDCEEIGMKSIHLRLAADTTKEELVAAINELNADETIDGMIVQLPLPKHLNENEILSYIDPKKDVDGLSAWQMGRLALGIPELQPCTPSGVMELLKAYNISVAGKNAVVIGRSNIVGKPMALMLLRENATVTVCHSKTKDLTKIAAAADILVVAIGRAKFVTADMVKDGAVVIDVGMNRADGYLCGDVDFEAVKDKCSFITPVPGGVGLLTRTMLLANTIKAYELYGK
jgi:methylenetetrahydrofolate dehydrogenase (NADP+)/methenyltetrahydrofolate cyclohydrolase